MTLDQLRHKLNNEPQSIEFPETMAVIESLYGFTETAFTNGGVENAAGQNSGSCKIFAFGKLQGLDEAQTLALFGSYYREDVLQHPESDNHANIRAFLQHGWAGISSGIEQALSAKQ